MAAPAPMEVDTPTAAVSSAEDDAAAGLKIYKKLLHALFRTLDLHDADSRLASEKQLVAYHHAARFFELKDSILAVLKDGPNAEVLRSGDSAIPDAYRDAVLSVHKELFEGEPSERPSDGALRGKRIFGHRGVVRFIQNLPGLPQSIHGISIFLPSRPRSTESAKEDDVFRFASSSSSEPLDMLGVEKSALVLTLDSFMKGAVVVVSPVLRDSEVVQKSASEAAQELAALFSSEPDVWKACVRNSKGFFSRADLLLLAEVLKSTATVSRIAHTTPEKPARTNPATQVLSNGTSADGVVESPDKPSASQSRHANKDGQSQAAASKGDKDGNAAKGGDGEETSHIAYETLLAAVCEEMDFFVDAEQDWLDLKKQLLVYHHAAELNEEREKMAAAISGSREDEQVASLKAPYLNAVDKCKAELLEILAKDGLKAKKLFSGHDHTIRYHTIKGLPFLSRKSCVFLRERPQSTSDVLRKTPSVFRDLVRFKGQGSPLGQLEDRGLALVLEVREKVPRAFLVISPLLECPEEIEKVMAGTWPDIEAALRQHMVDLITRDSDAWRFFIQRHANIVTKDSLKLIQKVLKNCPIGTGATVMRGAEDLEEELKEAQNIAEEAAKARAEAEERAKQAEEEKELYVEGLERKKERCKERVEKAKKKAEEAKLDKLEAQNKEEEAVRSVSCLKAEHAEAMAKMSRDHDEVVERLGRQERALERAEEEVASLLDANQELMAALAESQDVSHSRKKKMEQLKTDLKESQLATKAALTESEKARCAEAKATAELKSNREALAESENAKVAAEQQKHQARLAEAKATAELQLKVDAVKHLSDMNITLRTEVAKANDATTAAQKETEKAKEREGLANGALSDRTKELKAAVAEASDLRTSVKEAETKQETAKKETEKAKSNEEAAKAQVTQARAELKVKSDEVAQISKICENLKAEAAKASNDAAAAAVCVQEAEDATKEAKKETAQAKGELAVKVDLMKELRSSNEKLRVEISEANDQRESAIAKLQDVDKRVDAEKEAKLKVETDLKAQLEEVETLTKQCKALSSEAARAAEEAAASKRREESAVEVANQAEILIADARRAENKASAELQVKSQEAARLTDSYTALQKEMAQVRAEAAAARERAATAECSAEEAKIAKLRTESELEIQIAALSKIQASNTVIRTELLEAKAVADEAKQTLQKAEEMLAEMKTSEAQALSDAKAAQAASKKAKTEAKAHQSALGELKTKYDSVVAKVEEAGEKAAKALQEADASRRQEIRAKAALKAQARQNKKLTDDAVKHRAEAARDRTRAEAAEKSAEEAQKEMKIALSASEITEDEVRRLAKLGVTSVVGGGSSSSSSSSEPPLKKLKEADSFEIPDIAADLEDALKTPQKIVLPMGASQESSLFDSIWNGVQSTPAAASDAAELTKEAPKKSRKSKVVKAKAKAKTKAKSQVRKSVTKKVEEATRASATSKSKSVVDLLRWQYPVLRRRIRQKRPEAPAVTQSSNDID
eukprot:TRINITY_DN1688_c0_g1_i1.p1 TRINITY_DN1688_c0_g1~~TRINITY_DN1688_c0_g1_i1.p1  ORF type:complete len:1496 (-),score=538.22 TRINITY_DN1688_c0_g1_i1:303-4790(-)